jgi:hypothetical protein
MTKVTLIIPRRSTDNFGEPIAKIFEYIALLNSQAEEEYILCIDFSNTVFISPILIGGLVYLADRHEMCGGECEFIFPTQTSSLKSYFETIRFYNGYDFNVDVVENLKGIFLNYDNKTYIPIVKFPTSLDAASNNLREGILTALDKLLVKQLNLSGPYITAISYLLQEPTQNIVDHSDAERGLVFAQFFPSKNYIDIFIADLGKGIFQSYIDSGLHAPKTDEDALEYAVYGKSTKDEFGSRGFGISSSKEMLVKGLNGKFMLVSGNAAFIKTPDREEIFKLNPEVNVQGCFVILRIPILTNESFNPALYYG